MGCHRLYSYRLKLDELNAVRREAEARQAGCPTIPAATRQDDSVLGLIPVPSPLGQSSQ